MIAILPSARAGVRNLSRRQEFLPYLTPASIGGNLSEGGGERQVKLLEIVEVLTRSCILYLDSGFGHHDEID